MAGGLASLANPATLIGLAALDLTFLSLGYSIKMAGEGINEISEGIVNLAQNVSGDELLKIAGGLGAITAAMTLGSAAGGILSLFGSTDGMASSINAITSNVDDLERVGGAFEHISNALNADAAQFTALEDMINTISNAEVGKFSFMAELNEIMSKPLKVEFKDKDIAVNIQLDNYMDSRRITETMNITRRVELQMENYKKGKSGPKGTDRTI